MFLRRKALLKGVPGLRISGVGAAPLKATALRPHHLVDVGPNATQGGNRGPPVSQSPHRDVRDEAPTAVRLVRLERPAPSGEPVSQLRQRPKLPIRTGGPGRLLTLPVDPGDRDLVCDRWRHVVEVALRGVEPAPAANPLPRRGEVTRSRLVRAELRAATSNERLTARCCLVPARRSSSTFDRMPRA